MIKADLNGIRYSRYVKSAVTFLSFLVLHIWSAYGAQQADTEKMLRRITPDEVLIDGPARVKDRMFADSFYETSSILQGARKGEWAEWTNTFGYTHKNITGYCSVTRQDRFSDENYNGNTGFYLNLGDSYVHEELGFGWDVSYNYRFQNIVEYGHKIVKGLYWQAGYNYRTYDGDDTHLVYPGLIYYFGNSYLSADYGISFIENRDTSQFGTVKGDFAVTDFLRWVCMFAMGERLYDIYGYDARKEGGYILSTALNFKIHKDVNFRVGYSYGTEKPKFIKRSVNFGLTFKY